MPLILKHDPGEWDGTFASTLEFMVKNLLADGPVEITVTWARRDEGYRLQKQVMILLQCVNGTLFFKDAIRIDADDVEEVEV